MTGLNKGLEMDCTELLKVSLVKRREPGWRGGLG